MGVLDVKIEQGHTETGYANGRTYESFRSGPNSFGNYGIQLSFKNNSNKTIKYAVFVFVAYNSVGDMIPSLDNGTPEARLRVTGPLGPGKSAKEVYWDRVFPNHSLRNVAIKSVEIEYMDGSEATIKGSELGKYKDPPAPGCVCCSVAAIIIAIMGAASSC